MTTMQKCTFAEAVGAYIIVEVGPRTRNLSVGRDIRFLEQYLLDPATNPFSNKPVADVTDRDILAFLVSLADRPAVARLCTRKIRAFFAWAMWPSRRMQFGLEINPALYILPRHIAGRPQARLRFLEVDELHAYLAAAATLKPHQQAFAEGLALTGQRPSDLGRMRWSELYLDRQVWAAKRGNAYTARVILSDAFISKLAGMRSELPANAGDFVFSATQGRTPLLHLGPMKSALSEKMDSILQNAPGSSSCEWRWTDLRRTVICKLVEGGLYWKDAFRATGSSMPEDVRSSIRMFGTEAGIREALNRYAAALDAMMQKRGFNSGSDS
ncbi:hypothetical protein HJB99_30820 [Rhizobium sp. NLR17b]|uniref:hypothetical protein n=1 Tax=Rhizobium sp. NLR17b TaxID=2731114 RepID=UPI001C82F60C|nr:hypothetical protein [Rhizobium sp. NLR17b]MBX5272991.1 hypothetical protein [Rhizobium sp. NLR17b]